MKDDACAMVRDIVLEVLEDQAATVQRGDGVLRAGTKERRQALVFCAESIASRVADRIDRRWVDGPTDMDMLAPPDAAIEDGKVVCRERAMVDLDEHERIARAALAETAGWWRQGGFEKYNVFCQCDDGLAPELGRVLLRMNTHWPNEATAAHIAANSPPVTLALIARIRELEAGLADSMTRAPERDRLERILVKGVVLP